jgi:hypothetical protein
VTIEFDELEWANFHDVVIEVLGHYERPTLEKIFTLLPLDIRGIAFSWGLSDTPFRDEVYVWINANKAKVLEVIDNEC